MTIKKLTEALAAAKTERDEFARHSLAEAAHAIQSEDKLVVAEARLSELAVENARLIEALTTSQLDAEEWHLAAIAEGRAKLRAEGELRDRDRATQQRVIGLRINEKEMPNMDWVQLGGASFTINYVVARLVEIGILTRDGAAAENKGETDGIQT